VTISRTADTILRRGTICDYFFEFSGGKLAVNTGFFQRADCAKPFTIEEFASIVEKSSTYQGESRYRCQKLAKRYETGDYDRVKTDVQNKSVSIRSDPKARPQLTNSLEIILNTYNVTLKYEDRKTGPDGRTIKIDASSIGGAIGKATREFVKSLDRKQRFDMNKGLKIEAVRVTTDKSEVPTEAPREPEASAQ
jgi:hypothetical protein